MAPTKISITLLLGLIALTGCVSDPGDGASDDGSGGHGGSSGGGGGGGGDPAGDGDPEDLDAPPVYPTQHPRIYLTPHRARLEAALASGAPAANRFKATVDSWVAGASIWGFEAWNGALLAQLTSEPAYCTRPIAEVEAQVVAAEARIAAGQQPEVARDHNLHVGALIGELALVYDWCFDQVTAAQRTRWIAYANQAVSNVWNPPGARWGGKAFPGSGWSVNNPSNNYYYSFLRATMLLGLATLGENPEAEGLLAQFRDAKIYGQLLPTFEAELVGGGSREGTGYGVAMRKLYELYDWWKSTTGENLAKKTGHTRASMIAFIHQVMPTLDKIAPIGDHARDMTAPFFDYHRDYLQELIALFPGDSVARRAKALIAGSNVPMMSMPFMHADDFLSERPELDPVPLDGLNPAYHARGIGEVYARSGWDKGATWVNLIAGAYTESHAHQDQGSLMIYKGGWLAYDANIHSTSGLAQATTAHSLVRIDSGGQPVKQIASTTSTLEALHQGDGFLYTSADLTPAYKGNPAVHKVQRELVYVQPNLVIVYDRVHSAPGTTQTWQLATPVAPALAGATATITNAGHALAVTRIAPAAATSSVHDFRTTGEFTGGFRIDQRMAGGDHRYLHVLGVDGAVASATPAGPEGVTVEVAGAGPVTVVFERDGVGATLTLGGQTHTLGAGVATLPE